MPNEFDFSQFGSQQNQPAQIGGFDFGSFGEKIDISKEEIDTSFTTRVKEDLMARSENVAEIADKYQFGNITIAEGALQVAGQAAGGLFDILGSAISAVIPDVIENPIVRGISALIETAPIKKIAETYQGFKEKHPRAAADLEAGVNLVMALGVPKVGKTATGPAVSTTGRTLVKSGQVGIEAQKTGLARQLTRPLRTKAVQEAEVARTTETGFGPFKRSVVKPTAQEARSQAAVIEIPGISTKKTFQQNYNVVNKYNRGLAEQLATDLRTNDFIFTTKELRARLNSAKEELKNSPLLVGDNEKIANKLIAELDRRLEKVSNKGSELLKLRKEYDNWVEGQKPRVFDPSSDNAFSLVNSKIRRTINEFLDEKAPNVGVKKSLSKQSAIYDALDNLKVRAAVEADTAIGRAFQRMMEAVGIKNKVVQQIAAIVGIGGLGAASTFAPAAAGIGITTFVGYQAGKLIMNPKLRVLMGELLIEYGKVSGPAEAAIVRKEIEEALK